MMVATYLRQSAATGNIDYRRCDHKYDGNDIRMKSHKRVMYQLQIGNDCLPSKKKNVRRYGRIAGCCLFERSSTHEADTIKNSDPGVLLRQVICCRIAV